MEKTKITVPNGTRDLIFEEVTAERELEGRIDGLLDVLGYRPVRTPSVEYYDLFDQSNRYIDETQMYKLTDGDGRLIVLRPDNTAPIARLVSSKLHAEPLPLLIRYGQRVFRSSAAYNALRHEVLQYGVEVIAATGGARICASSSRRSRRFRSAAAIIKSKSAMRSSSTRSSIRWSFPPTKRRRSRRIWRPRIRR